jgi:hypothetical protein
MNDCEKRNDPAAECAAALVPVLLGRMPAESRRLQALNAVVSGERAGGCGPESAQDLVQVSLELDELGWLMGVVARGLGVDLLGERRRKTGLASLLQLVRDALHGRGRALAPAGQRLPQVGTNAEGGPHAAWVVCVLLWRGALEQPPGSTPTPWSLLPMNEAEGIGHVLHVAGRPSREILAACETLAAPIAGARFEAQRESWTLELPGACLVPAP